MTAITLTELAKSFSIEECERKSAEELLDILNEEVGKRYAEIREDDESLRLFIGTEEDFDKYDPEKAKSIEELIFNCKQLPVTNIASLLKFKVDPVLPTLYLDHFLSAKDEISFLSDRCKRSYWTVVRDAIRQGRFEEGQNTLGAVQEKLGYLRSAVKDLNDVCDVSDQNISSFIDLAGKSLVLSRFEQGFRTSNDCKNLLADILFDLKENYDGKDLSRKDIQNVVGEHAYNGVSNAGFGVVKYKISTASGRVERFPPKGPDRLVQAGLSNYEPENNSTESLPEVIDLGPGNYSVLDQDGCTNRQDPYESNTKPCQLPEKQGGVVKYLKTFVSGLLPGKKK